MNWTRLVEKDENTTITINVSNGKMTVFSGEDEELKTEVGPGQVVRVHISDHNETVDEREDLIHDLFKNGAIVGRSKTAKLTNKRAMINYLSFARPIYVACEEGSSAILSISLSLDDLNIEYMSGHSYFVDVYKVTEGEEEKVAILERERGGRLKMYKKHK